ncbi:MAG: hypothetical protein M3Q78_02285 [Acidobacteriota bacterium]|jgi:hypothetical protein|nr:hypothetical protein [Acidobacteriota bacterium]
MDVYHKVLVKLYEVTDGKDTQSVDFKDLVRTAGFLGNYNDIYDVMSSQGWISESKKPDYVGITHWGVSEAKKSAGGAPDDSQAVKKEANRLANQAKELASLVEEFTADTSKEKFEKVGKIFEEMTVTIARLKNTVH